jgi:hypothetical protein
VVRLGPRSHGSQVYVLVLGCELLRPTGGDGEGAGNTEHGAGEYHGHHSPDVTVG